MPKTYSWDDRKFHSIPAWVRKLTVDVYGVDPTESVFVLPYELDKSLQETLKGLVGTEDQYREAIEALQAEMLLKASKIQLANVDANLQTQIDDLAFVKSLVQEATTQDIIVTYRNNSTQRIKMTEAIKSGYYDEVTQELVLVLDDNTEIRIPAAAIVGGLATQEYVDDELALKENTENKTNNWQTIPDNIHYPSEKLVNDTIQAVRQESSNAFVAKDKQKVKTTESVEVTIDSTGKLFTSASPTVFATQAEVNIGTVVDKAVSPATLSNNFPSKAALAPYISSKNLALDLQGKEYLGNGVYRMFNSLGINLDYNTYNGVYTLNGLTENGYPDFLKFELPNQQMYVKLYYISGSTSNTAYPRGNIRFPNQTNTDITNQALKEGYYIDRDIQEFVLYSRPDAGYTNYQFKLQIEKGSTATPFAVPSGVIPYIPEVKSALDSEYVKDSEFDEYTNDLDTYLLANAQFNENTYARKMIEILPETNVTIFNSSNSYQQIIPYTLTKNPKLVLVSLGNDAINEKFQIPIGIETKCRSTETFEDSNNWWISTYTTDIIINYVGGNFDIKITNYAESHVNVTSVGDSFEDSNQTAQRIRGIWALAYE